MDRRAFLAAATVLLAGCGQDDGTDESPAETSPGTAGSQDPATTDPTSQTPTDAPTQTDTPTQTGTPTPTATPRPASVTVTDLTAPSTIEIGTTVTLTVTAENTGEESGSLSAPVEARIGTGDWTATDSTVELTVPAAETVTEEIELASQEYVQPASYRLEGVDPVARTRFVARELSLGEGHLLPNGVRLSVPDVEFSETYTYEGADGETELEPTEGEKWAVATVRAENEADEVAAAPLVSDVAFFRGEEEYAYQHISDNRDRYRGGDLDPGEVSEGDLPSDVPADAERSDLRLEHGDEYDGGQATVFWSLAE